jgi:hypothetical protein
MTKWTKRDLKDLLLFYTETITVVALAKSVGRSKILAVMVGIYAICLVGFILFLHSAG